MKSIDVEINRHNKRVTGRTTGKTSPSSIMSSKDSRKENNTTTIKIAPKDASERASGADPGPGDMNAAPSEAPQLVDIPSPPTSSQLVVKSADKSSSSATNPASTADKSVSKPASNVDKSASKPVSIADKSASKPASTADKSVSKPVSTADKSASKPASNLDKSVSKPASTVDKTASAADKPSSAHHLISTANNEGVAEHDVDEEGEGEVEQPAASIKSASPKSSSAASPRSSSAASPKPSSAGLRTSDHEHGHHHDKDKDGKKKVTRFRYHKRVTVRTTGKTSPTAIMSKVNQKDHKAGITPSTIEDMDPQELMKRAGIKGSQKTHWRVRLRQTKRVTKNGKTSTQTKVAYRDSEGNKRVRTSLSPFCKDCGKKLEECKCETKSQS